MTDLNLTELDVLERGAAEARRTWNEGCTDDAWAHVRALMALNDAARMQLRPLLDLVGRMGRVLESVEREQEAEANTPRPCLFCYEAEHVRDCPGLEVSAVLDDYRRAKGDRVVGAELSDEAKVWLECIEECDGAEVHEEAWVYAEELRTAGLITLSGARGPGNAWKRASLALCDKCGRSGD